MNSEDDDEQCRLLLRSLKGTAEGLLASHTANVWSVYGGLGRLHAAVLKVLQHGLNVYNQSGEPDCWSFVEALQWLQPSLATSPPFRPFGSREISSKSSSPTEVRNSRYSDWLYKSLESHSLSGKLSWLLSDANHLESCYTSSAFLRRQPYAEAALICLRSVEQGQPSLLTDLDPRLFLSQWTSKHYARSHRRCSSFPDNIKPGSFPSKLNRRLHESRRSTTLPHFKTQLSTPVTFSVSKGLDRHWNSEPILFRNFLPSGIKFRARGRSATATDIKRQTLTSQNFTSLLTVNYSDLQRLSSEKLNSSLKQSEDKTPKSSVDGKMKFFDRDSIEIAHEASEDLCASGETQNNNEDNSSQNVVSQSDVLPKRPTNLSLSLNTSTGDDQDKTIDSMQGSSDSLSLKVSTSDQKIISDNSQVVEKSSPSFKSDLHKWIVERGHRKMPSDPSSAMQVKTSYTPSSSLSLSPPFLTGAAHGSLPLSRRPSEANSFLASSGRFSDPAEELGRENAHFSVSEAMIAAIERAKCERIEKGRSKQTSRCDDTVNSEEDDDEEIARLKEKIRVCRREKQREKRVRRALRSRRPPQTQCLLSDGRTDTPNTTTDMSDPSPPSSTSSLESEPEIRDMPLEPSQPGAPTDNLVRLRDGGLSVSLASLYSESELVSRQNAARLEDAGVGERWARSAEGVAWGLLRQFSGKALPRDSELQWLVSEQDAPQQLLPLPSSWPVSPDEAEDEDMSRATPLRGNLQWAPPRAQIIFTPHPTPNRRVLLVNQGYLCAGCGMKVETQYANKFRYCEYLGRYFCTGCHGNQLAIIPGKVLAKWDFKRCPVSSFSYRLLEQMQADALFRVEDLNPSLFHKSRQLAKCKIARYQVSQYRDFVINCRFATHLHELFERESRHMTTDPELYSLRDLVDVKSGELLTRLQELVTASNKHVKSCELCMARGFVCELCRSQDVIFPWDVTKVFRCRHCGCCLHFSCWKGSTSPATTPSLASPDDCPRCKRIKARQASSNAQN